MLNQREVLGLISNGRHMLGEIQDGKMNADVLRMKLFDILGADDAFKRVVLFDQLYGSLPKDAEARVQVYHYEIAPGGFTNYHLHNGATFFICLQGEFEAHFEEGILVRAKAGDVYSEPIGKIHRGHNPRKDIANMGLGISLTSSDRDPVTNLPDHFLR
jgi:quercetin dioxygenase-like cupin family protein